MVFQREITVGIFQLLKMYTRKKEVDRKKGFRQIAGELGVNPAILSRWLAGMRPLTNSDGQILAENLSPAVYSFLGISRPVFDES